MTTDAATVALERLERLQLRLEELTGEDRFNPAVPEALVAAGLHLLAVPVESGGLGGGLRAAALLLAAIGSIDGSSALGLAMHTCFVGGAVGSTGWPVDLRASFLHDVLAAGALANSAATEERTGSPARGAIPDTRAEPDGTGWRLTGEKTWTTWLPALRFALVSAREVVEPSPSSDEGEGLRISQFLVDLDAPGVARLAGEDSLGMRGSASGRLVLEGVRVAGDHRVVTRRPRDPDPRGPAQSAWFGISLAATYLGVGEGARDRVARWALDRRPGDGTTAVADIPSVRLRLGRMDALLRAARIVLLDVAARWDANAPSERGRLAGDIALAKMTTTSAAVEATDEALRIAGGPGYAAGRLERAFRDARAGFINPPLDDLTREGFARDVLERVRTGDVPADRGGSIPPVASSRQPPDRLART